MFYLPVHWSAPANVNAISTMRTGGCSQPPFDTFNLAFHVEDNPDNVIANRHKLLTILPLAPAWLEQVHSADVVIVDKSFDCTKVLAADAFYTRTKNQPIAIMTADCLPILLTDNKGQQIAAIHGGWKGLVLGIIENTLELFTGENKNIIAWLGPAIGKEHFEVGQDVYDAFCDKNVIHQCAFFKKNNTVSNKYMADLFMLATQILKQQGITLIYTEQYCTFANNNKFYSYRREGITGRMASIIWLS